MPLVSSHELDILQIITWTKLILQCKMLYALCFAAVVSSASAGPLTVVRTWTGGCMGTFTVHADNAVHGWKAHLTFANPLDKLDVTTVVHYPINNMSLYKLLCFLFWLIISNIMETKHIILAKSNVMLVFQLTENNEILNFDFYKIW